MARVKSHVIRGQNASKLGDESFPRPSKHTRLLTGPYLPIHVPKTFIGTFSSPREKSHIRDFTIIFSCHHNSSSLDPVSPYWSQLMRSLNVSRDAGGVHRRKAIFVYSLCACLSACSDIYDMSHSIRTLLLFF